MPITPTLAAFAAAPIKIPETTLRVLQMSMLDWAACAHAGREEPVSQMVRDMVLEEAGAPMAGLVGGGKAPTRAAALVNGTTSHALDYDDTHFAHIGHTSVVVLPAALAMAQKTGASGRALQEAFLVGSEAAIRIGVWLGRQHYQGGFHQTSTSGAFGAALAAARLLNLSARHCEFLLGLVATRAAGLKAQFGTMGKPYNAGHAAAVGVEAAELVARGLSGNPGALEGPGGFGATHLGQGVDSAFDGLGEKWLFDEVSHKYHACCHGLHAALEALDVMLPLDPAEISEITVKTNPRWMNVCNKPTPSTGLGAKFSYTTVLAMRLLGHDTGRLNSYSKAVCADRSLLALRSKVHVQASERIPETASEVTLRLHSGRSLTAAHDLMTPLPPSERQSKILRKSRSLLGVALATDLQSLIAGQASADRIMARLGG